MSELTSPKERSPEPQPLNNTIPVSKCQGNTLVTIDTITEIDYRIEVYPHCIVMKPSDQYKFSFPNKHHGRGLIREFSKRSRFRLFATLAKISNNLDYQPIFITLTYHHGHENTPKPNHSCLHNFLVQLRNIDPDIQFIWRKEYQKRGAPHYHLIIFRSKNCSISDDEKFHQGLNDIWHRIADPKSYRHKEYGCQVQYIYNYKEACFYMSKYLAKCDNSNGDLTEGKHWGCSQNLPFKLINVIKCNENGYSKTIESIRKWLISKGRQIQADPDYLNIFYEQTIFIDEKDFIQVILEEENKITINH